MQLYVFIAQKTFLSLKLRVLVISIELSEFICVGYCSAFKAQTSMEEFKLLLNIITGAEIILHLKWIQKDYFFCT